MVEMPVLFYLDPDIDKDVNTTEVPEITLSYTFFAAEMKVDHIIDQRTPKGENMSAEQKHPYHCRASPWPALGSMAALTMAIGGVLFMHEHDYGIYLMMIGLALVLATMLYWWRDVVREAEYQGHHTPLFR